MQSGKNKNETSVSIPFYEGKTLKTGLANLFHSSSQDPQFKFLMPIRRRPNSLSSDIKFFGQHNKVLKIPSNVDTSRQKSQK